MNRVLSFLALFILISSEARNVPVFQARPSDRTLYIRSIPEVKGYNSHIYEVLMTPSSAKDEPAMLSKSVAVLHSLSGAAIGEVNITDVGNGKMQLRLTANYLPTSANLGLSIHQNGDCRKLGPVFKPDQPANSIPSPETPAGYLGTFNANESGFLEVEMTLGPKLALSGHRNVLARGIALHNMGNTGSSSGLVACGVLGRVGTSVQDIIISGRRRRHHFQH